MARGKNNTPPEKAGPTREELIECITRSGYLMESRLVRLLTSNGFFVEPNQVMADARTGTSREIDLIAELSDYDKPLRNKVVAKTTFVIEAKNNDLPFVLITPRPSTMSNAFVSRVKYAETSGDAPFVRQIDLYEFKDHTETNLYSQFCVISRKKGQGRELMASHSDDIYASLLKMAEYVEQEVRDSINWQQWALKENRDDIWRMFFWQPLLVLQGQLKICDSGRNGRPTLHNAKFARLEFNWHSGAKPMITVIHIVTATHLLKHLQEIVAVDDAIEEKMLSLRRPLDELR